jgi:hypothetical protein
MAKSVDIEKEIDKLREKKYNANKGKRGFHSNNNTQNMGKQRGITYTTEETPSGEQSLPDIH